MNTLSWLIYAAEVSDRASGLCKLLAFLFPLIMGGPAVVAAFVMAYDDNYGKGAILSKWAPWTLLPAVLVVEVALLVGAVALPSKSTLYMIAASEAGEAIVTSPDAVEMMGDLKQIIKKRLRDELAK